MKIIYNVEDSKCIKRGWTYILVSEDKRRLKIGKAIPNLERRINQHMYDKYYQRYGFSFLLALDDAKYEVTLHALFDEYRARYRWIGDDQYGEHFTGKEAMIKSRALYQEQIEKNHGIDYFFWKNTQTTVWEWFHVPPRKVGSKVREIVLENIS